MASYSWASTKRVSNSHRPFKKKPVSCAPRTRSFIGVDHLPSVPIACTGRDILARAKVCLSFFNLALMLKCIRSMQNGTGKTGAFVIPTLERVDTTKTQTQALILVPTRELALQTSQVCKTLGKHLKVEVMVSTGGTSLKEDILRLQSAPHILVGTPGRILDLSSRGIADLSKCSSFIMDEADKLLSPEFTGKSRSASLHSVDPDAFVLKEVLDKLVPLMPKNRQMLLFSATFPLLVKDFKVGCYRSGVCYWLTR